MNKHKLKDFLQQELTPHQSTFKETSFDKTNREYVCQDKSVHPVYDFDGYIKAHFGNQGLPASPDAIYVGTKKLYFVEFKNEKVADIDKKQMEKKFVQGTQELKQMLEAFTPRDCQYFFCVVHKPKQQVRYFNPSYIQESALRSRLEELNKTQGQFYDKIFVEDVSFYQQTFHQLGC